MIVVNFAWLKILRLVRDFKLIISIVLSVYRKALNESIENFSSYIFSFRLFWV